ncbi:hypothetical protein EVAR_44541_1 [Eumeta japonica]|uniref:Uncharacterized protein n=1 Tax=Eumeta variegata TaxID=151549 RepID=A0A4C1XCI9_EUMVA|nr:hypothetical protein EVAR_44541_1 [Eumeta japonica]
MYPQGHDEQNGVWSPVRSRSKIPISSKPAVRNFVPKKIRHTRVECSGWRHSEGPRPKVRGVEGCGRLIINERCAEIDGPSQTSSGTTPAGGRYRDKARRLRERKCGLGSGETEACRVLK